jgi:hypothetical protein
MTRFVLFLVAAAAALGTAGCRDGTRSVPADALAITTSATPRFDVPEYETRGKFPQIAEIRRADGVNVKAVNTALREAVLADERGYEPLARRRRRVFARDNSVYRISPGLYSTAVDRALISASSVVVSGVLPTVREESEGEGLRHFWVAFILDARSGKRVKIDQLFRDPERGVRSLGQAWAAIIRQTVCGPFHRDFYPDARFALLTTGIAVAVPSTGQCDRDVTVVPYGTLRPLLSSWGRRLVDGVRAPAPN